MEPLGFRASLKAVVGSPYLRSIAWVIGLASFATTVAGWQFKAIAKEQIPDTDQLAAFFGSFNMMAGLASLGLQLVLTSRVLRSVGVGLALFIVPVAMASTTLGVLVFGSLVAVSALKASDQVLRYSIDKVTVELLYLPLVGGRDVPREVVHRHGDLPVWRRARRPRRAGVRRRSRLAVRCRLAGSRWRSWRPGWRRRPWRAAST